MPAEPTERVATTGRGQEGPYLLLLKDTAEAVAGSASLEEALGAVVALVARRLRFAVCSIYLANPDGELVLRASHGLNPEALGRVRMRPDEGLTGQVFQSEKSLFTSRAESHPAFKYFPETGEERFSSFGGVPLLRRGHAIGVLTVQNVRPYAFQANKIMTLETLAQQVASLIGVPGGALGGELGPGPLGAAATEASPPGPEAVRDGAVASAAGAGPGADLRATSAALGRPFGLARRARQILAGIGTSAGAGVGRALVLGADPLHTPPPGRAFTDPQTELARFERARGDAVGRLEELALRFEGRLGTAPAAILRAHQELVLDGTIEAGIRRRVLERRVPIERAVYDEFEECAAQLRALASPLVREKAHDLLDARAELLDALGLVSGDGPSSEARRLLEAEDAVVVAELLTPAQTARLDPTRVTALVTAHGSDTSHASILARSLGIPAVVAVPDVVAAVAAGDRLLVDGDAGLLFVAPDDDLVADYAQRSRAAREVEARIARALRAYRDQDPPARPQVPGVVLLANVGLPLELEAARASCRADGHGGQSTAQHTAQPTNGAAGIGLLRTELYFLQQRAWPTLDEQVAFYRSVFQAAPAGPVVVRLLDAGGDKALPFLEPIAEPNPILGFRSVRFLLAHPEVAKVQLEALLRAADPCGTDLRILVPLVTAAWELTAVRGMMDAIARRRGLTPRPLGMMIEVPSVLFQLEDLVPLVEFVSLGTNDLIQYLLAVDRENERVRQYCSPFHPAVIRALASLCERLDALGKPASVCGELAGQPLGALALLALGYRTLSVRPRALPALHYLLYRISEGRLAALRPELLAATTSGEAERLLRRALRADAPALLEL